MKRNFNVAKTFWVSRLETVKNTLKDFDFQDLLRITGGIPRTFPGDAEDFINEALYILKYLEENKYIKAEQKIEQFTYLGVSNIHNISLSFELKFNELTTEETSIANSLNSKPVLNSIHNGDVVYGNKNIHNISNTESEKRFWSKNFILPLIIGILLLLIGAYFNRSSSANSAKNLAPLFAPQFNIQSEQFTFESKGDVMIENIKWYIPGEQSYISTAKSTALSYKDLVDGIVFNVEGYLLDWAKVRNAENKTIDISGVIACHIDWLNDNENLSIPIAVQITYIDSNKVSTTTNYIGQIIGLKRSGDNSSAELQVEKLGVSNLELTNFITDPSWPTAVAKRMSAKIDSSNTSVFKENYSNGHCEYISKTTIQPQ